MIDTDFEHAFSGYAVVSAEGFIADAGGVMPDQLKFEQDWVYFQAALDNADITLIGRQSHEAAPNVKRRRRLVFSSRVNGITEEDDVTVWIDPAKADPQAAITGMVGGGARVAVVGGQGVFDWVLMNPGFSEFHLSLAHAVRLGEGRPMLSAAPGLDAAIARLQASGLALAERRWMDRDAALEFLLYRRPSGS